MSESPELLKYRKQCFSQCGEDLILRHIFNSLKIQTPSYLDVGANHPYLFNNTAYFYLAGSRGITVEPNPYLTKLFREERPEDVVLNAGIADTEGVQDFYLIDPAVFGTFSKAAADEFVQVHGYRVQETIPTPCLTVTGLLDQHFNGVCPDFISIDAEGVDETIVDSIIKDQLPFTAICVETISYSCKGMGVKNHDLIQKLVAAGYLNYADTNINTIFVKEKIWRRG